MPIFMRFGINLEKVRTKRPEFGFFCIEIHGEIAPKIVSFRLVKTYPFTYDYIRH